MEHYDCFTMTQQSLVGQGLLVIETLRSRSDTPHSVGLLWTSDQPVAEPLPNTHRRQTTMTPAGFEPAIPGTEGQQTHFLGRAATRIGSYDNTSSIIIVIIIIIIIIMRSNSNYKTSVELGPFGRIKILKLLRNSLLVPHNTPLSSYVYWTVHHCDS